MAEQDAGQGQPVAQGDSQLGAAPAAAENTGAPAEHMIPKARFDEVNKRLRELEAAAASAEKTREAAERKRMEEQQEFRELYETERQRAADMESQVTALRETQRQATIHANLRQAAQAAGFADPEDAVHFIAADQLQADESGAVANAKQMIEALAKSKPYLLATAQPAPGVQPGPKQAGTGAPSDAEVREFAARYGVRPEFVKQTLGR